MKIFIVTEGGGRIGLGHIARCTALYQAFKNEGLRSSLIVNGDNTAEKILKGYAHVTFNWLDNKKRLFEVINGSDIVVIDSYLAAISVYREVSRLTKTVVCMDDNMRIDYPAGIVVNGAISAEIMKYPDRTGMEYLLGSRYIPLRKEFWSVPAKRINGTIRSIMVTFGGADGKNMTPKIVNFLNAQYPEVVKNVIVGAGFRNIREIERFKGRKVNLIYEPDTRKMRSVMLESDIAISAAGQTLHELARVGVPAIAVCVADNQLRGARSWQKSGFIKYAGKYNSKTLFRELSAAMREFAFLSARRAASAAGRGLVDGRGAERIAREAVAAAKKIRVLLTCVGGKFSFDTIKALKQSNDPEIEIIGVDANEDVAVRYMPDMLTSFYRVPDGRLWQAKIDEVLEICKKEHVDIIIPCADEEVAAVAANKRRFEKNNIICALGEAAWGNDKLRLFDLLSVKGIPIPKYCAVNNMEDLKEKAANFGYPNNRFVVKLRFSRGARGVFIVDKDDPNYSIEKLSDLEIFNPANTVAIEMVYLPAYDIDVLAKDGEPLCIVPRRREWKNELSPSSEGCVVEKNSALVDYVEKIIRALRLNGVYDFDCGTTTDGKPAIYEINPRFSGAVAASLGAGINVPVMLVRMLLGMDIPQVKINFGVHMRPIEKKVTLDSRKYTICKMSFSNEESYICK